MTYPIIRWNGGGGGVLSGNTLAIKLGDGGGNFIPMLLPTTVDSASIAASFLRSRSDVSTETGSGPAAPSEATISRCACVMRLAGDVPADVAASALEACHADPDNFIASLGASGLDTSSCSGAAAAAASLFQNPWVIGGAAALVLGGLAFVALK